MGLFNWRGWGRALLVAAAGGSWVAGKALKADHGWNNNGNGTDTCGFSAYPLFLASSPLNNKDFHPSTPRKY